MKKNLDRAVAAGGIAILFTGGVAAGALLTSPAVATAAQDIAGGAAGLAAQIPGGGPAGVLANGGALGGGQLLAAAATYIGISEADVRTGLEAGKSLADIAAEHGKTRDGLIAALSDAAAKQIPALVDQKGAPGGPFGHGGPGARVEGDPIAAAATYLGTTADDLRAKLTAGQTLAAVANATSGKSRDGLIQALVASATAKIDQAQAAGTITADQATREKADLPADMTRLVDSTGKGRALHR